MLVDILQDRHLAGYGLIKVGDRRHFPQVLAEQLIEQGIAVAVQPKASKSRKED